MEDKPLTYAEALAEIDRLRKEVAELKRRRDELSDWALSPDTMKAREAGVKVDD